MKFFKKVQTKEKWDFEAVFPLGECDEKMGFPKQCFA
jgi:hypothetical protein